MILRRLLLTLAPLLLAAGTATAQGFPTKPLTLIVPFPAGGPSDALARALAQGMAADLKQTVVVENIGGASGTIGLTKLVRAVKNGVQKVVQWAGNVIRSPVFGAIVGVATLIPGVGPIAAAGYAGVKAAMAIADGASRGDPKALETIGKYALPGGEKAMALIKSVAPT